MLVSKNARTSSLIHIGEMLDKFSKFEKYENDHDFEKLKIYGILWEMRNVS